MFVTHGKGILGSQDEYNAKHRRLCGTPFRASAQLARFSAVVAGRCGPVTVARRSCGFDAGRRACVCVRVLPRVMPRAAGRPL